MGGILRTWDRDRRRCAVEGVVMQLLFRSKNQKVTVEYREDGRMIYRNRVTDECLISPRTFPDFNSAEEALVRSGVSNWPVVRAEDVL